MLNENISAIIKLQALWRGNLTRKKFHVMKMQQRGGSRYFTADESRETISKSKFDPNKKRVRKDKHFYKSGATYEGEWKGGFRDGLGTQVWPDGASYEGEWHLNR
jgi:hypothetical protein